MDATFVVFTFPVEDTFMGALSHQVRIQVVARPAPGGYQVHFEMAPAPPASVQTRLEGLMRIEESRVGGTWRGDGFVAADRLASQTYRALANAEVGTRPVWIVLDGGYAQVRVDPGDDPHSTQARLCKHLADHHVLFDTTIATIDASWYGRVHTTLMPRMRAG